MGAFFSGQSSWSACRRLVAAAQPGPVSITWLKGNILSKPSLLTQRLQNGGAIWENSVAVSQSVKHTVALWPSRSTPSNLPRKNKNISQHNNLYTNVCIIYKIQKVETIQMYTNWWMNEQNVVYPRSELSLSNEKEQKYWVHTLVCMNLENMRSG